jgi:hypothetical protein
LRTTRPTLEVVFCTACSMAALAACTAESAGDRCGRMSSKDSTPAASSVAVSEHSDLGVSLTPSCPLAYDCSLKPSTCGRWLLRNSARSSR